MTNRIIVSVTNDLSTDHRVHKVCTSLQAFGFDVLLLGFKQADSKALYREYDTSRFSMWFIKGPLFYAEFSIRLFFFLLFNKSDSCPRGFLLLCFLGGDLSEVTHQSSLRVLDFVQWLVSGTVNPRRVSYASTCAGRQEQTRGSQEVTMKEVRYI